MTSAVTSQRTKDSGITNRLAVLVVGVILSVFLWWFFGGLGFWVLPGFAVIFISIGEILYKALLRNVSERSATLRAGIMTFFVGVALYVSVATQVMLAYIQMISLIVIALGVIGAAAGMFLRSKQ
jgi:hypothetical protein